MFPHGVQSKLILFLLCMLLILYIIDICYAQDDYMERKGIEGLFKKKGDADPRAPKGWQKALGIGAFFVTFAVYKWL